MDPLFLAQLKSLIQPEDHWISTLSNVSAFIMHGMLQLNWAGFYLRYDDEKDGPVLLLGPFQGNTACVRIPFGNGVCGTAARSGETIVVPDVHKFPGHIACDCASASEVVIPIRDRFGEVCGVLDIDSPVLDRFTPDDRAALESCVRLIEERTCIHALD